VQGAGGLALPDSMSAGNLEAALSPITGPKRGHSPPREPGLADGFIGAEAQARHHGDRRG